MLQGWRGWRENVCVRDRVNYFLFGVEQVWKTQFYPQANSDRLVVTTFVGEDSEAACDLAGKSGMINE